MINGLTPTHLIILVLVIVLLFGAKKLPDAARSLGKSMRIFKSEVKEMQSESKHDDADKPSPSPTPISSERVEPASTPATEPSTEQRPA